MSTGKSCPGPAPALGRVCPVHCTQLFRASDPSLEKPETSASQSWFLRRTNTQGSLKTIITVPLIIMESKSFHQMVIFFFLSLFHLPDHFFCYWAVFPSVPVFELADCLTQSWNPTTVGRQGQGEAHTVLSFICCRNIPT